MDPGERARRIVAECRALGFHRVGITPVEPAARWDVYRDWAERGYAGELDYLTSPGDREARRDPRALLAAAKTVVAVALSYARPDEPVSVERGRPRGAIARYARGEDYHLVLKRKLAELARRIDATAWRPCVDTAPILERDVAERAGLGFVAKNTMLIAPGLGSYVLLGELLLDVEATANPDPEASRKRCGACRACLDACPTGAFVDAYVLDARRCISYLTIESRGAIPRELRAAIGTRIFGCDVCQEVCPFNAAADDAAPELSAPRVPAAPELIPLLSIGAHQFRRFVRRTALRRIPRALLVRNVCVALGNAGDPAAIAPLRRAVAFEGALVRRHAAWALGRLGDREGLAARLAVETDPDVRDEIEHALAG